MKAIETQAIITSLRSKVDGSLSLTVHTPELSTNEKALFMELQGRNTNVLIQPEDSDLVEPEKIDGEIRTKTQSQRLRGVLYILWQQTGEKGEFEDFYRKCIERIIDSIKAKLD